jgi:hypothetical protein
VSDDVLRTDLVARLNALDEAITHGHTLFVGSTAKEAAEEIKRLRDALSDIASGEMGLNVCIKLAKKTLGTS